MNKITCIESRIDKEQNHYACFLIEALEIGQGITLGNSLRRTLLSDLTSFAITGARINNLKHEFSIIPCVREDVLEILLNLKEIIFKESFLKKETLIRRKSKAFLHVKGPVIVTAGMFRLPPDCFKILNPAQYICTLLDDSEFYLEVDIENGKGYRTIEEVNKLKANEIFHPYIPTTFFIDTIFMPVKKVNYKVKLIHDTRGNIKESLTLEILTNGSTTPKRSLQDSLKILLSLFYSVAATPTFLKVASEFSKEFFKEE